MRVSSPQRKFLWICSNLNLTDFGMQNKDIKVYKHTKKSVSNQSNSHSFRDILFFPYGQPFTEPLFHPIPSHCRFQRGTQRKSQVKGRKDTHLTTKLKCQDSQLIELWSQVHLARIFLFYPKYILWLSVMVYYFIKFIFRHAIVEYAINKWSKANSDGNNSHNAGKVNNKSIDLNVGNVIYTGHKNQR